MGTTSSKPRAPWGHAPGGGYGQGYYPGQPFIPGQMQMPVGMPQMQMLPGGQQPFIPGATQPTVPGQLPMGMPMAMAMPQTAQPRRRSKKSRRKSQRSRTNRDTGDFVPMLSQPLIHPQPAPVIPGQASSRRSRSHRESRPRGRTQTPFPREQEIDEEDEETSSEDDDDDDNGQDYRDVRRRGSESRRANASLAELVQPMPAAAPEVFGPTDGRPSVLPTRRNPLPSPPMDIYEMSPYKHILHLPTTEDLLLHRSTSVKGPSRRGTTKKKKGFLRNLFNPQPESTEPAIRFVPVAVGDRTSHDEAAPAPVSMTLNSAVPQPATAVTGGAPILPDAAYDPVAAPGQHRLGPDPSLPFVPPPQGPVPLQGHSGSIYGSHRHTTGQLRFNHATHYGWVNQAPFRVLHDNRTYPTASHLFEAMRFGTPQFGELYASVPQDDHAGVREVSDRLMRQQGDLPDYEHRFMDNMKEVLQLKFLQHPNLRAQLLETGDLELVYDDPGDSFWGAGADGHGLNHLGKALMQVRDYLRQQYMQPGH
ncbi:hypothetical protein DL96DRAFT_422537 [Flagelloscypha sp. PMI_526]|nr:hypothetical protein DL96DRAFT_422537 [Flagelloscypha sp. PMI_526]